MPGKGMTCWDKRELCDLNCVYATTQATEDSPSLSECSTDCMVAQSSCTDSDETLAYVEVIRCCVLCTLVKKLFLSVRRGSAVFSYTPCTYLLLRVFCRMYISCRLAS